MPRFKQAVHHIPWYVFLFSWYSILFLFQQNFIKLSLGVILKPLIFVSFACFVVLAIIRLIVPDYKKSGLVTGVLIFVIFMYGPLHKLLFFNSFNIGPLQIRWDYIYLAFSGILILASFIYLLKTKKIFIRINQILNIGSFSLILLVLVPMIISYIKIHQIGQGNSSEELTSNDNPDANAGKNAVSKPDIYYIIPDDYGSPDILQKDYNFNDDQFINYLKAKGFYIAQNSKTNYPFSTFMIASALNMNYLNAQNYPAIKHQPGGTVVDNAFNKPKVASFLKSQGYSFFYIGGWYNPIKSNDSADINFVYDNKLNLDEFSDTLLHNTVFYPLVLRYFGLSGDANEAANSLYQAQALTYMPAQVSPKFVFVDLLLPHTPWQFNDQCGISGRLPNTAPVIRFTSQLSCTNILLMKAIDAILKNSKTPPVIILQTDEGAKRNNNEAIKYPNKNGVIGGFKDASLDTILERTKILNAFYLPGHSDQLYQTISPVNTMRVVLNEYFNAKLPILPDKTYTFDDYDKLYKFEFNDVTDLVKDK